MAARLQPQILETIRTHRLLVAGDRVAVAVSGGGDSVALLLLLEELSARLGITMLAAHFNHRLRGADSDADEAFVRQLAGERGIELFVAGEDVAGQARRRHANLEDVARQRRYAFFAALIAAGRATRVAVAHTADDQAETLLARLVRGTGPAGLAGIYPVVDHVIRPLLEVRRQQLRQYLTARGQTWREDASNRDQTRLRARIRHRLLPVLESDFSSAVIEHLATLARLARDDQAFWQTLLEDRFQALVTKDDEGFSVAVADLLSPLRLSATPADANSAAAMDALAQRLVRRIVEAVKGGRQQLTARHVEQVLRLAARSTSGHRLELPAGIKLERRFDRLHFSRSRGRGQSAETPAAPPAYSYGVQLPPAGAVSVEIAEIGKRVCLKVIDWPRAASETTRKPDALDAALLRPPLVLRNWMPGDAYRPKGRRHVRKLKRLLLEGRVPLRDRPGWLVLTSAGRLAWVRGLPAAADFAAGAGTRTGVVIAEEAQ